MLTKTITRVMPSGGRVGMHLKLEDGGVTVIDRDFTESFTKGQGLTSALKTVIGEAMQKAIDEYKANIALYLHADYETARSQIDGALTL